MCGIAGYSVSAESSALSGPSIVPSKAVPKFGISIGSLLNLKPEISAIRSFRLIPALISAALGADRFDTDGTKYQFVCPSLRRTRDGGVW